MDSTLTKNDTKDDMSDEESRRFSTCSSPSSSSFYKMSVDSDDARSTSSSKSFHKPYSTTTTRDEVLFMDPISRPSNSNNNRRSYDFRERPERRSVNRRSSLLPKSKALLRVIDQADEDTHLADLEMRREHETTTQLNKMDPNSKQLRDVPAASWTKVPDITMPLYQCSKLNPEIEMTNFQFEHISHHKSIKRKASEDRFEPYPTSFSMKRRAVSPSVSLNGSPVLTGISSPPTSFSLYTSSNAAAAANTRPKPNNTAFNLQDASGGLSRMSISE